MKTIQIGFKNAYNNKHAGFSSRVIAWWTLGIFSHSYICLNNTIYEADPSKGKVIKRELDNESGYEKVYLTITNKQYKLIENFLNSALGNKYDRVGLVGFVLPTSDREDRWFCSELVANCLKIIGYVPLWFLDPSKISPNRLASILYITKQYRLSRIITFPRIFNIGI